MRYQDLKSEQTGILVVDVQGDFTRARAGALAVEGADDDYLETVVSATKEFHKKGFRVFATQDFHPETHVSFYNNHENHAPFDVIEIDGRPQVLWPPHCVMGTENSKVLIDDALLEAVVKKGTDPSYDSYSGFFDDNGADTGLDHILKAAGINTLLVYGLATDYCVRATALDAVRQGFQTILVRDLCRGVAQDTTDAALKEMAAAGISVIDAADLIGS